MGWVGRTGGVSREACVWGEKGWTYRVALVCKSTAFTVFLVCEWVCDRLFLVVVCLLVVAALKGKSNFMWMHS